MSAAATARRGPGIGRLLLGVNVFVMLVPVAAVMFLRVYHKHLVQQTERGLISESVLIGEAWRDRLLEAQGRAPDAAGSIRPPGASDPQWYPIEPVLVPGSLLPPTPDPARHAPEREGPQWEAGRRIRPLLLRARQFNLSGARVLDARGCVVATSGEDLGACLDGLPEVDSALAGRYAAVVRERPNDDSPPLSSISRGGDLRIFTATPVLEDGRVIGVVRMARTALSPLKGLWLDRQSLLLGLLASTVLTALASFSIARAIGRPVREITEAARAIARGEPRRPFTPGRRVPAEMLELSEALDTMTRQLSDRAQYIAEFAANASHELKTPITAVLGAAELLREHGADMSDAERARFAANIEADAARMERLVTRLLHLARIQSAPDSAQALDLPEFLRGLAARHGQRVRLDLAGCPPTLTMNAEHLESAVRNLLDNALRHGAGQPVDVAATGRDGRVAISVRDRGPGISAGNRARVFERFFTTERDRGGTGLGLSIVQAVAQTRGGSVSFDTGPAGTTFTLVV